MGSRSADEGAEHIYAASHEWIDRALRTDDSLFTPGQATWTSQNLAVLRERFLDRRDEFRGPGFFDKLELLLEGSSREVYQLMGEIVYVTYLIVWRGAMGRGKKLEYINRVLGWSPAGVSIPDHLVRGLEPGIADPGGFFRSDFAIYPGYVIEFVEHWKELEPEERVRLLSDPWEFKRVVLNVPFRSVALSSSPGGPAGQQQALLHLVFPDTFEGIISSNVKNSIVSCRWFARYIVDSDQDVDRRLQQIREGLESDLGRDFNFFEERVSDQWSTNANPWDEFVRRARAYAETGRLETEEIGYKLEIGSQFALARQAILRGADNWVELLEEGLASRDGHPLDWRLADSFRNWIESSPDDALLALQAIWRPDEVPVAERISSFTDRLPESEMGGAGSHAKLASVLLMGVDPELYSPYGREMFRYAYDCTRYDRPGRGASAAGEYEHALSFLDLFMAEAHQRDLLMRHHLDAQSFVWAVQRQPPIPLEAKTPELSGIEALAERLYFEDASRLRRIETMLEDKKQVIFQGPPGTGKTYVARELAKFLAGNNGSFKIVQFHPSYSYEDFVQGIRPDVTGSDQLQYRIRKGPLLQAAQRALDAPLPARHFLVIDEINRGVLGRILGELYFLLEYRGEGVQLQYQDEEAADFSLPENLYIIGTMNTADRSIAMVDLALRRRFYFEEFHPSKPPVVGVLRRWLETNTSGMDWVADVVDRANELLGEESDAAIGHSYFMRDGLDEDALELIWEHGVLPYVKEHLFGADDDRIGAFELGSLRQAVGSGD